jgi:glutamate carboxypeptidase
MLTTANPFDSKIILDGIRRWVEIETPTEAPGQVNKLATATLDGLGVDGKGAHTHCEQMYISSIEPQTRLLYRLYQTLR